MRDTMTVLLLGIGADTTNASPTPPVYDDGSFEYIPIPESEGPEGTVENSTYGNTDLTHSKGTLDSYLDYIRPGADGERLRGNDMSKWPLHHDPNFDSLTYGETTSRSAYVKRIRKLENGDIVAFYTGLSDGSSKKHRYIIGYFTVNEVIDFSDIEGKSFDEMSKEERDRIAEEHEDNAHMKRYRASGDIHNGNGLVIVDGTEPGDLLDKAFKISKHRTSCHYYLTDELQEKFSPQEGGNPDRNAYLGGIKQAHRLGIDNEEFIETVDR